VDFGRCQVRDLVVVYGEFVGVGVVGGAFGSFGGRVV